jgi:hypothetical protein
LDTTDPVSDERHFFVGRLTGCVVASSTLISLSMVFEDHDSGALLSFGIAVVSTALLFAFSIARKGRQRLVARRVATAYLVAGILLLLNYSLCRDHSRWLFLSGGYKAQVLAQPDNGQLKHVEWDGWGFAGVADTTAFLVFDPTDSLSETSGAPPIRARGLPCEVARVRRLEHQWYAVLFYSDTYWGQGGCK